MVSAVFGCLKFGVPKRVNSTHFENLKNQKLFPKANLGKKNSEIVSTWRGLENSKEAPSKQTQPCESEQEYGINKVLESLHLKKIFSN